MATGSSTYTSTRNRLAAEPYTSENIVAILLRDGMGSGNRGVKNYYLISHTSLTARVLSFPRCELPTLNAPAAESIYPPIGRRMFAPKMAACFSSATISSA